MGMTFNQQHNFVLERSSHLNDSWNDVRIDENMFDNIDATNIHGDMIVYHIVCLHVLKIFQPFFWK